MERSPTSSVFWLGAHGGLPPSQTSRPSQRAELPPRSGSSKYLFHELIKQAFISRKRNMQTKGVYVGGFPFIKSPETSSPEGLRLSQHSQTHTKHPWCLDQMKRLAGLLLCWLHQAHTVFPADAFIIKYQVTGGTNIYITLTYENNQKKVFASRNLKY